MTSGSDQPALYGRLAGWWPLISPPEEYVEEAATVLALLRSAQVPVRQVLELGSGGGSNAVHLARDVELTLVDVSEDMLAVSRRLNPDCRHVLGDMRTVRLGRTFDAVLVHDAVDYMTTEDDLRQALATAYAHCRPGGVAVVVPDEIAETYDGLTDAGGADAPDGRGARYLAWGWDPDPSDTWTTTHYAFLLRDADGSVRVEHDTHRIGLFGRDVWLRLLADVGFEPDAVLEQTAEDRRPRTVFLGRR